ncbi:MAG: protease, partial [candidate division Zixibacteria bacterium]
SKRLIFSDKDLNLYSVDLATKTQTLIDRSSRNEIRRYSFSPDSRFVAYSKDLDNNITAIFLYSFDEDRIYQATEGLANDYSPVFDPDGKYLYFLSQRSFNPLLGNYEFQFVNTAITNLYLIILADDGESPFLPGSDEVEIKADGDKKDEKDTSDGEADIKPVRIDFTGI